MSHTRSNSKIKTNAITGTYQYSVRKDGFHISPPLGAGASDDIRYVTQLRLWLMPALGPTATTAAAVVCVPFSPYVVFKTLNIAFSGIHPIDYFFLLRHLTVPHPCAMDTYACMLYRHLARWDSGVLEGIAIRPSGNSSTIIPLFRVIYTAVLVVVSSCLFSDLQLGGAFSGVKFTKLSRQQGCPAVFAEESSVRQDQTSVPRVKRGGYRGEPRGVLYVRRSPPLQKQRHKLGTCCPSVAWTCPGSRERVQRSVGSLVCGVAVTSRFQ